VPDTVTDTNPQAVAGVTAPAPAEGPGPALAAALQAESAHTGEGHAASEAHHGFNFDLLNESHNWGYPAIEWIHGKGPQLILNLPAYADRNQAVLSAKPEFADAAPTAEQKDWAAAYGLDHGIADTSTLAKCMVVAQHEAQLGTMPRGILSGFTHQTFWSTIALLLLAAVLLIFAKRKPDQYRPTNRLQHVIEMMVLFVRDDIVRPNISHHSERWTPFIASLFFALLACNLFGLVPIFGTATSSIWVTAAFAVPVFLLMLFQGFVNNGPGFPFKLVPVHWSWNPMDMIIWILLLGIELFSLVVKPSVLAIRLFANMLAGHTVLLVFASLGFIVCATNPDQTGMFTGLGIASWFIAVAFYFLELLVAFIQAYVFALLTAVFIGSCIHPEH
jgi:F-type H+-transporting ATPase subunit a